MLNLLKRTACNSEPKCTDTWQPWMVGHIGNGGKRLGRRTPNSYDLGTKWGDSRSEQDTHAMQCQDNYMDGIYGRRGGNCPSLWVYFTFHAQFSMARNLPLMAGSVERRFTILKLSPPPPHSERLQWLLITHARRHMQATA